MYFIWDNVNKTFQKANLMQLLISTFTFSHQTPLSLSHSARHIECLQCDQMLEKSRTIMYNSCPKKYSQTILLKLLLPNICAKNF